LECETGLSPIEIDPRTFLKDHCTLPALPEVVGQIQDMVRDENVVIEKVADLIGSDPALLAQTLKVVNSAYYGLPREVSRPQMAIAFLGLNEVYRMVLSLSVINTVSIVGKKEQLHRFWYHSMYTAVCCKYLADRYPHPLSKDDLWSAAVLHDIGKLVYMKMFPDHYEQIKRCCKQNGSLFSAAEEALGVPPSGYIGTLLCDHWRLPEVVRKACERHRLQDLRVQGEGSPTPLQGLICLGNLLTVLVTERLSDEVQEDIKGVVMPALDISDEDFETLVEEISSLKGDVEGLMGQFR
jgi:HD-like signal output (HDOD) protein